MKILEMLMKHGRIRKILTFPRFLLMMILIGIIIRIMTFFTDIPRFDGAFYSTVGSNVAPQHDFVSFGGSPTYSFSLTYPTYLAGFYSILGFSIHVTQLASIVMSIAVLSVAYLTTKKSHG